MLIEINIHQFSMKEKQIILIIVFLIAFPLIHETGHFFMAKILGGEIVDFTYSYVSLKPGSIESIQNIILFKLGGLIFTFYPSTLTYLYLYKINSDYKNAFLLYVYLSPLSAMSDFIDINQMVSII
jgi:hypothetical protein